MLKVGKGCPHWLSSESGQIKTTLPVGVSQELPDRSNIGDSPGKGLEKSFKPVLSTPVATKLLIFTVTAIFKKKYANFNCEV